MLAPSLAVPDPLRRLRHILTTMYEVHREARRQTGRTGGCPFGNLSGEMMALTPAIREKLLSIFERHYAFYEALLREARDAGQISLEDVPTRARALFAFLQGIQMLAHAHNDPELLRAFVPDVFRLIGAADPEPPETA